MIDTDFQYWQNQAKRADPQYQGKSRWARLLFAHLRTMCPEFVNQAAKAGALKAVLIVSEQEATESMSHLTMDGLPANLAEEQVSNDLLERFPPEDQSENAELKEMERDHEDQESVDQVNQYLKTLPVPSSPPPLASQFEAGRKMRLKNNDQ